MILNINKPKDWTSFDVVKKVRSTLNIKKVGHAGTLDPLATGVLIVLTQKDTKKQNDFMAMEKEYYYEIALGASSETYDLEKPLEFSAKDTSSISKESVETLIKEKYMGEIEQTVPAYSAVKYKGKSLYKYARKGTATEDMLPTKTVTIYDFHIEAFGFEDVISVTGDTEKLPVIKGKVVCSKGTYIRSLANDIGEDLGVGGVLLKLVRTRVGDYKVEDSRTLESLSQSEHIPS